MRSTHSTKTNQLASRTTGCVSDLPAGKMQDTCKPYLFTVVLGSLSPIKVLSVLASAEAEAQLTKVNHGLSSQQL
jgi:hypothetical protein